MIRREFDEWQLWLRGQFEELEDYARQLRKCAEIARETDKPLKAKVYKRFAWDIGIEASVLREKLRAGTRKHDEREYKRRHTCEKCGETVYTIWIGEDDGERLCTICAMEKCNAAYASPCCAYCGSVIDTRSDSACFDGDNQFCGTECALRYNGFERDGE